MNRLLGLNIEFYVDRNGKLKITTKGDLGDIYIVAGFKVKEFRGSKYIFPILGIEMPKK